MFLVVFSSKPKAAQCLVRWATPQLHDINAVEKMADPALRGLYPPKSLFRFADIIALCSGQLISSHTLLYMTQYFLH